MKTQQSGQVHHTPGPWKYHRLDGITGLIAEDGTVLARINTPCNNERTGKANAALIAAAPALYNYVANKADSGDNEARLLIKQILGGCFYVSAKG